MFINFFNKIIKSIKDPTFVYEASREKPGKAVLYIVLVVVLFSGIGGGVKSLKFRGDMGEILAIVEQPSFPDFRLENGLFTIDAEEPITVSTADFILIVDVTGQKNINHIIDYETGYLLTSDTFIMTNRGAEPTYVDLDTLNLYPLDKSVLVGALNFAMGPGVAVFILAYIGIAIASNFYRTLIVLLITILFKRMFLLEEMKSSQIYSMILYASTIGVISYETMSLIITFIPMVNIIQLFVTAGTVIFFFLPVSAVLSRVLTFARNLKD